MRLLEEGVESLEAGLVSAESAASEKEAAGAARVAELESQMEAAADAFEEELAVAEAAAL